MDNPSRYTYITKVQYEQILKDLNIDQSENGGLGSSQSRDLIDEAVGDLESDLVKRFVVPLVAVSGSYESAQFYAKQKVLNAVKAKIRERIGQDKMKNIVIDSTEKFIDTKKISYREHIKGLLDPEKIFGFKLQSFAADGSLNPVQRIGLARPDDSRSASINTDDILF